MTPWPWVPAVLAVSILGACASRTTTHEVVREQPIIQQQPVVVAPQPTVTVVERVVPMPTPPQEAVPASPGTGYSWVAGHYEWVNGQWAWHPGQWHVGVIRPLPSVIVESPPAPPTTSARWVPGYWAFVGNDWTWVKGHWQ